ncbi:MAG: DUF1122 family protein, partial [Candidatus Calescibacterium sp.]|nr:DUF1122 family protein [Candidatus Calescibacterium sp.]
MKEFLKDLSSVFEVSKVERGRFLEEENITIERGGKRVMFIKAFYGRKPYWKEWVELFHIEPWFFCSE